MQTPIASIIDRHVGNRVRIRRLDLGISQQELAGELGLTFQQVQKYEKGANRIGASRLYQLAMCLRVSVNFFFEGLDGADSRDDQNHLMAAFKAASPRFGAREFVDLNRAFQSIENEDLKKIILALVEAVAEKQEDDPATTNLHIDPRP